MTQPNFFQLRASLVGAIELTGKTPELASSGFYADRLQRALTRFDHATRETDRTYTEWRMLLGKELTAFRTARRDWDRVVALCDEHALDGAPTRRIDYTEREAVLRLLDDMASFLDDHAQTWEWVPTWSAKLRSHLDAAQAARAASEDRYLEYTEFVKSRITAFEDARSLLQEFFRDAGTDHRGTDALEEVRYDRL